LRLGSDFDILDVGEASDMIRLAEAIKFYARLNVRYDVV